MIHHIRDQSRTINHCCSGTLIHLWRTPFRAPPYSPGIHTTSFSPPGEKLQNQMSFSSKQRVNYKLFSLRLSIFFWVSIRVPLLHCPTLPAECCYSYIGSSLFINGKLISNSNSLIFQQWKMLVLRKILYFSKQHFMQTISGCSWILFYAVCRPSTACMIQFYMVLKYRQLDLFKLI